MKIIITESQLRKIVSSIISKQNNNINGIRQGMNLIYEGRQVKNSLEYIKKRIADATSMKDFKKKNPNWFTMYQYIRNNYKNDPDNNWETLMSDFTKDRFKYTLDNIKKRIADATSLLDFKKKNPNWMSIYQYIRNNYKNDPDNNWIALTSVFDDSFVKPKLNDIKKKFADATSWEDFKEKNPNWVTIYAYIKRNYDNDPDNNWESLISVFEDAPFKYTLKNIKKRIANATSWEDFKEKNPNISNMSLYINKNYANDPDNNWRSLMSVFKDIPNKYSLDKIKKRISDATSWEDFKEKNPNYISMYSYIKIKYGNDPDNNWESLVSVFKDAPFKYSLDKIKKKISDATSWKDFKEKNSNWFNMYSYIRNNYKNDPDNNWETLVSVFEDRFIYTLDNIKKRIADATSLMDFKKKNPNWPSIYMHIKRNYDNDPDNNWKTLMSNF